MNYQINLLRSSKKPVGNEPHFWHALLLIIICCTFEALPNKKISEDNTRIEFYERRIKKKVKRSYHLFAIIWYKLPIFLNTQRYKLCKVSSNISSWLLGGSEKKKKKELPFATFVLFSLFLKHRNNFFTLQYESLQVTLKKKQNCLQL